MRETLRYRYADAFIRASRGELHPRLGTEAAYADMFADALMATVDGQSCAFNPRAWQDIVYGPQRRPDGTS